MMIGNIGRKFLRYQPEALVAHGQPGQTTAWGALIGTKDREHQSVHAAHSFLLYTH